MIKVAIVILNWNGKAYLEQFLPSVLKHSDQPGVSVIVADNASTDDSISFLQQQFPSVRLILLEENLGYAGGYHKALREIEATYYVLLNSDVEVSPGWINPIVEEMDNNPAIGACMPKIKAFHNKSYFEYAGASGGYIDQYGYPFCRGRMLNQLEKDTGQYDDKRYIFWASGACLFIRSKAYHQAGGLDQDFFVHMEEIDLCWRLQNNGYKIAVVPSVEVYHVGGGTLPNNNPRKLYYNYRNSLYMLYKNLPGKKLWNILLTRMILDGLSAITYLLQLSFPFVMAVFKAHIAFYKNFRSLHRKRLAHKQPTGQLPVTVYSSSILKYFYLKKKRKFSQLSLLNLQDLKIE